MTLPLEYPSNHFPYLSFTGNSRHKAGDMPVAGQNHTPSHTTYNFQTPMHVFGLGEYSEETPAARGKHANSAHTCVEGIALRGIMFTLEWTTG